MLIQCMIYGVSIHVSGETPDVSKLLLFLFMLFHLSESGLCDPCFCYDVEHCGFIPSLPLSSRYSLTKYQGQLSGVPQPPVCFLYSSSYHICAN